MLQRFVPILSSWNGPQREVQQHKRIGIVNESTVEKWCDNNVQLLFEGATLGYWWLD